MLATSAADSTGVGELVAALDRHFLHLEQHGLLAERRKKRLEIRTREVVDRAVRRWIWSSDGQAGEVESALKDVTAGVKSPYEAAAAIVAKLLGGVGV